EASIYGKAAERVAREAPGALLKIGLVLPSQMSPVDLFGDLLAAQGGEDADDDDDVLLQEAAKATPGLWLVDVHGTLLLLQITRRRGIVHVDLIRQTATPPEGPLFVGDHIGLDDCVHVDLTDAADHSDTGLQLLHPLPHVGG